MSAIEAGRGAPFEWIGEDTTQAERVKIGGIIKNRSLSMLGILAIPDRPGVAAAIFSALGARKVSCRLIVHTRDLNNLTSIVVCVARGDLEPGLEVLNSLSQRVEAGGVIYEKDVGMISIFGPHFGQRPGIAGIMFSGLAAAGISILAISTSISSVSCIVHEDDIDDAVTATSEVFELP